MEEIGIIRRTIQDVLVPEMQGIKERLAGHDEKFVSIDKRFDQVDKRFEQIDKRFEQIDQRFDRIEKRLDALEKTVTEGFAALRAAIDRIESRLQFVEFDKRLYRLEILAEQAGRGSKSAPAA